MITQRPDVQKRLAVAMSEAQLQSNVLDVCGKLDLIVHHDRPARVKDGWRTPIEGTAGFPDLVIVSRSARVLFVELKREREARSALQMVWADRIPPVMYRLWRPVHWFDGTILIELRQMAGR